MAADRCTWAATDMVSAGLGARAGSGVAASKEPPACVLPRATCCAAVPPSAGGGGVPGCDVPAAAAAAAGAATAAAPALAAPAAGLQAALLAAAEVAAACWVLVAAGGLNRLNGACLRAPTAGGCRDLAETLMAEAEGPGPDCSGRLTPWHATLGFSTGVLAASLGAAEVGRPAVAGAAAGFVRPGTRKVRLRCSAVCLWHSCTCRPASGCGCCCSTLA